MSRPTPPFARSRIRLTIRVLLVAAIAVATLLFVRGPVRAQTGGDPAPDPRVANLERDFLRGMIPHHRGAIMMSELALERAARPEVRELAEENIASQTREIELMTNWLAAWYGEQPPAGNMMPDDIMERMDMPMLYGTMPTNAEMMARMERLETLEGAEFDIEYMSILTDHHAMAMMMAAPVLLSGHHAALYDIAAQITEDQGRQIKEMRHYLSEFYDVPRPLRADR